MAGKRDKPEEIQSKLRQNGGKIPWSINAAPFAGGKNAPCLHSGDHAGFLRG